MTMKKMTMKKMTKKKKTKLKVVGVMRKLSSTIFNLNKTKWSCLAKEKHLSNTRRQWARKSRNSSMRCNTPTNRSKYTRAWSRFTKRHSIGPLLHSETILNIFLPTRCHPWNPPNCCNYTRKLRQKESRDEKRIRKTNIRRTLISSEVSWSS